MRNLFVNPGSNLQGVISIPGDKSITHRALIISALQNPGMRVVLRNWLQSLDCLATLKIMQMLGVTIRFLNTSDLEIISVGLYGLQEPSQVLDVGNSGTALRLLTGLLAAQSFSSRITGDLSICRRPMDRVIVPLTQMGAQIFAQAGGHAPLTIIGGRKIQAIEYVMPVASAQVKSALLLASLYAGDESKISTPSACRDHTEIMLQYFAGLAARQEIILDIPGDISSAAFFMVAATIAPGSDILMPNIGINPTRSAVLDILKQMGANITCTNVRNLNSELRADIRVRYSGHLKAVEIPVELVANAIDELPILGLAAACAQGTTIMRGAGELRHKESDRIEMLAAGFRALGIKVNVFSDGMAIEGGVISGGTVQSGGDHRIAMTFALAGLVAEQPIMVQDTANIATSFPTFFNVAKNAGLSLGENTCLI